MSGFVRKALGVSLLSLVTIGVSSAVAAPSDRIRISQLGLQQWNVESGLAGNWVRDIARDEEGAIWIATSGGLSRFDGWSFANWSNETDLDVPMDAVNALAVGPGGRLWVGFLRDGIRYLRGGRIEVDPRLEAFPGSLRVNDLLADSRGTLWIGSSEGLWTLGDSLEAFDVDPALTEANVRHLVSKDGEEIWARTADHGVWRIRSGRAERLPDIPDCYGASVAVGTDGAVVTACTEGVWRLAPGDSRWEEFSPERGVVAVFIDRSDAVWFSGRAGLTRWRDGVDEVLPPDRGLGDWRIRAWLEDDDGLWIGTFSAGLSRLREGPVRAVDVIEGLPLDGATAVVARPDGTVWISGDQDGLVHWSLSDGLIRHWTAADGLPDAPIWALAEDPRRPDRLWVGTGVGLAWIEGGQVGSLGPLGIVYEDDVRLIHVDTVDPDVLWVAGFSGGILEIRGPARIVHDERNGLGLSQVRVLHRDRQGRLWAGGDGGLFRLEGDSWLRERLDGVEVRSFRAIVEETDGTLWLGGENSGLVRRGADGVQQSAFPYSPLHTLELDSRGGLWVSGNEGVFRLQISDHEQWRHGRLDEIPIHRFAPRDGLRDIETNGWGRPASARLPDGRLVYPTHGVAVVDPGAIPEPVLEPHEVHVLDGWSADRPLELEQGSPIHLGARERTLRLRFSAIEFIRPEGVTFRYRLEGYDDDWLASASPREASYTRLAPGRFTFRLQARLPGRPWVESAISPEIVVAPFFWETAWFRGSLLLVALSLGYAGYRSRVSAMERRREELEAKVAERTRSLKQREQELLEAKEAAEGSNRAKSTFLSTMSHELRTPLNAILGFAQLIARDEKLSGEQRENALIIGRSGEHLLGLIDDVLEMSKIEAGRSTLTIESVDLWATIESVEQMVRGRAEEAGVTLVLERAPSSPARVRGDEQKLRQVLINLVGNAIKYAPHGRVELRVSGAVLGGFPAARIEVADSGIGIEADRVSEIFEPFVRSDDAAVASTGTGLGLPISREYVRRMGGDIHVDSRPGEGSTFWFTLPCQAGHADESEPRPARKLLALAPDERELRVLIADDDRSGRTLLRRTLEPVGFVVEEAGNGQEAIELCRSWRPDVVLMDVRMPGTDGLTATRRIRECENGERGSKPTLIVAVTAEAFEENRARAREAGCDDFITKPFREAEVVELLATRLGVRVLDERAPGIEAREATEDLAPRMRHLSSSLLLQLEQAAAALEPQTLDDVIETIRRHDVSTADALRGLAKEFEYKRIIALASDARLAVDA